MRFFNIAHYSNAFRELIEDKRKLKDLLDNSFFPGATFNNWTNRRFFITKSINTSGTIFDIGCANGFLLRCLQEWSQYTLEPYGIDINRKCIMQAKRLFKHQHGHFMSGSVKSMWRLSESLFPAQFKFIYWNVWDNYYFNNQEEVSALISVFERVMEGGRLIFGFYDSDKRKKNKFKRLEKLGFRFSNIIENPNSTPSSETICWIDKKRIK